MKFNPKILSIIITVSNFKILSLILKYPVFLTIITKGPYFVLLALFQHKYLKILVIFGLINKDPPKLIKYLALQKLWQNWCLEYRTDNGLKQWTKTLSF